MMTHPHTLTIVGLGAGDVRGGRAAVRDQWHGSRFFQGDASASAMARRSASHPAGSCPPPTHQAQFPAVAPE